MQDLSNVFVDVDMVGLQLCFVARECFMAEHVRHPLDLEAKRLLQRIIRCQFSTPPAYQSPTWLHTSIGDRFAMLPDTILVCLPPAFAPGHAHVFMCLCTSERDEELVTAHSLHFCTGELSTKLKSLRIFPTQLRDVVIPFRTDVGGELLRPDLVVESL